MGGVVRKRSTNTGPKSILDVDARSCLLRQARSATAPHRLVVRSRIILLLDDLGSEVEVARRLLVSARTVRRWRERFLAGGVNALSRDAPGRGRKPSVPPETMAAISRHVDRIRRGERVPGLRTLARELGVGLGSVHRLIAKARAER